ncbi:MAG TPA: hypothetical protein PLA50_17175 [Bacteroidia bacterium]|nr:hypothetical protein [Bacteroidia bacterium]
MHLNLSETLRCIRDFVILSVILAFWLQCFSAEMPDWFKGNLAGLIYLTITLLIVVRESKRRRKRDRNGMN